MKLQTANFGEIEISESGIVTFENGLPGFEDLKKFVFLQESADTPYAYMQSVEDEKVSFIIVSPFSFMPDYEFDIHAVDEEELQIESPSDVQVWVIMNVSDSIETSTINLIAPIIVNATKKLAKQIILHNSNYEAKQLIGKLGG